MAKCSYSFEPNMHQVHSMLKSKEKHSLTRKPVGELQEEGMVA